jgi:hypothetical protein
LISENHSNGKIGDGKWIKLEAERAIAKILCDLEVATGALVESIALKDLDVTNVEDKREVWFTKVAVKMKRIPGRSWEY